MRVVRFHLRFILFAIPSIQYGIVNCSHQALPALHLYKFALELIHLV